MKSDHFKTASHNCSVKEGFDCGENSIFVIQIHRHMDRRKFLALSAASVAAATVDSMLPAAGCKMNKCTGRMVGEEYNVIILGDTHFDTEPASVYHSDYYEKEEWLNRVQRAEFARNGEMWRERCPRMMDRAARLVDKDTRMYFQMGDLIQGDCGNPEVHRKMLENVLDSFKGTLGGLPFVTVVGNHDIRGMLAEEAYHEYMPERMSHELGKKIQKTTFAFTIGPDAYIVLDFNSPDPEEVERLLKGTEGARYTFVIVHGPLLPYDGRDCRWFFYGNAKYDGQRRHFRELFARRDVICLCGHTHTIELADWFGDGGRITQMTMNSVWSKDSLAQLEVLAHGAPEYGTLRRSSKNADGTSIKDETPLFDEYRPGLKRYMRAKGAGSFKMSVSGHGVTIDFYGGDSETVTESFVLR